MTKSIKMTPVRATIIFANGRAIKRGESSHEANKVVFFNVGFKQSFCVIPSIVEGPGEQVSPRDPPIPRLRDRDDGIAICLRARLRVIINTQCLTLLLNCPDVHSARPCGSTSGGGNRSWSFSA